VRLVPKLLRFWCAGRFGFDYISSSSSFMLLSSVGAPYKGQDLCHQRSFL
jgi:hypothetical protein